MSEFAVGSIENALYYTLSDKVPGLDQELCENIIKNNFIPGNNLQNLFQVMQNNKQIYAKYIQTTSIQEINAENIFCLLPCTLLSQVIANLAVLCHFEWCISFFGSCINVCLLFNKKFNDFLMTFFNCNQKRSCTIRLNAKMKIKLCY